MKKIPTLFVRHFEGRKIVAITEEVTPGMEWVLKGEGRATVKHDGACCAVIDGVYYKRYDAKNGKKPPENAIPCCDPDPVTGHWPHWVPVKNGDPADKWFMAALMNCPVPVPRDGNATYEALGPHFQGNPYHLYMDLLIEHGIVNVQVERSFEEIREYLRKTAIEGLVFWKDGEPQCKIKRSDFGFSWPDPAVQAAIWVPVAED